METRGGSLLVVGESKYNHIVSSYEHLGLIAIHSHAKFCEINLRGRNPINPDKDVIIIGSPCINRIKEAFDLYREGIQAGILSCKELKKMKKYFDTLPEFKEYIKNCTDN